MAEKDCRKMATLEKFKIFFYAETELPETCNKN
jgi:hypothetical protein